MIKLLAVFAVSLILAYLSEQNTAAALASGKRYAPYKDWAYVLLLVVLILFAGLRTYYNDTWTYMKNFEGAPSLAELFRDPTNLNPFKNPLFAICRSALREMTDNAQILIFTTSAFTQICFIRFLKKYSEHFTFSIFIYFTLGTYVFTLAAIKQVLAMAIVTLAFPFLEKKKWVPYYLIVFVGMLFHTYALAFAILPFFRTRPWRLFTVLFIAVIAVVMLNFESAITEFMEQANDLGKTIAEYEVFDDATINIFRLAVYAVPPLISLVFQKWVLDDTDRTENVLIHMSIISLAFMSLGTQSGANMFGRMGNYFELGTLCCLPKMLKKTFDDRTYRLISAIACICYFGFFYYANAIHGSFDQGYRSISLWQFVRELFVP